MHPQRGYYSIIQFCPDPARMESVNVGVVLLCPESSFLDVRISHENRRAQRLVGKSEFNRAAVEAAKLSLESRFKTDRESFRSIKDLQHFVDSRGNQLILTDPRPIKVFDALADLERLFEQLVTTEPGVKQTNLSEQPNQLFPELDRVFSELNLHHQDSVFIDFHAKLPIIEENLNVPYAYQNGKLNLVQPQRFAKRKKTALQSAKDLAFKGELIRDRGIGSASDAQLIVISSFENPDSELADHIGELFESFHVEHIYEKDLSSFTKQVQQEVASHNGQ